MATKKKKTKRQNKDIKMQQALDEKFMSEFGEPLIETFGDEKITKMNVADANLEYVRLFGANKNLYRSTPNLISGLKPGATRLIYTWWETCGRPQNTKPQTLAKLKFYKVSKIATDSVKYHPHSTAHQEELIGNYGQYWENNVMMIVPWGSYGNMCGHKPAAGRYLKAQMSEYCIDCFFKDFDKYAVPMRLSYTGDAMEPEYLPARYPHILFNPQFSGLGYGMVSNIFPCNMAEVIDATIALIKDPTADILLYPDSPTGADIVDAGQFKELNKTGNGNFVMRANSEIDYANHCIIVSSLPLNCNSTDVIRKIIEHRDKGNKQFKHIIKFDDRTQEGHVEIVIYLDNKESTKPERVLQELYKKSVGLRATFPVSLTVVDDFRPYEYGTKDLLLAWIDYRLDAVQSMLLNSYQQALNKQHMNNVLLMIFDKDNIQDAIDIARKSSTKKETEEKLIKRFKITSAQASVVADMHVYQFNKDQRKKYEEIAKELEAEIKDLKETLESDTSKIRDIVIKQLEEGKEKYGRKRLSRIVKESKQDTEAPDIEYLVAISTTGYIKKLPADAPLIGPLGRTHCPIHAIPINNRSSILIVDSTGMVTAVPVYEIPEVNDKSEEGIVADTGIPLNQLFTIDGNIQGILELPTQDILDSTDAEIVLVTKNGLAKRVPIEELKNVGNRPKKIISLKDKDTLVAASVSLDSKHQDIIIFTNMGRGIRLAMMDVKQYSANSQGMAMLKLNEGEYVQGASNINPNAKYFFFITDIGQVKITDTKFLHQMKRTDDLVILTKLLDNENLMGATSANKGDEVHIYRKKTTEDIVPIASLEVTTRTAGCGKVIKNAKSNPVTGYKIYHKK